MTRTLIALLAGVLLTWLPGGARAGALVDARGAAVLSGDGLAWQAANAPAVAAAAPGTLSLAFDTPIGNTGELTTLAKCMGADVGTTAVTMLLTHRTELNPIVVACAKLIGSTGAVGVIPCSIALSIAAYHLIAAIDNRDLTGAASLAICGSAARNVFVINH